jgi:hypothetical protein
MSATVIRKPIFVTATAEWPLGRSDRRPPLDILLLAEQIVDLGLHNPDPVLFSLCGRVSVLDKAGDRGDQELCEAELRARRVTEFGVDLKPLFDSTTDDR